MSSSTSSSEPELWTSDSAEVTAWHRFILRTAISATALSLSLLALFITFDPYDTGLFSLFDRHGVTETGGRMGDASRIHDEAFDSAVFGNSHIMPLRMDRLSAATGLKIMMLGIPGTGVREQMLLLDAYLRRHSPPKALIIGVDFIYCTADPRLHPAVPFPDWLYSRNPWAYVGGLFETHTFEVLGRRLLVLAGLGKTQKRDGNIDIYGGARHTPEQAAKIFASVSPQDFSSEESMPGFALLDQSLDQVAPDTAVLLVLPPIVASALPASGTLAGAAEQRCKQRADDVARHHANVRVLDWRKVTRETSDLGNFSDPSHYHDVVAEPMERDIAAALTQLRAEIAAGKGRSVD